MRIASARRAVALDEPLADEAVGLGDVGRGRRQAGADRPDRLVGDHQVGGGRAVRQRAVELAARRRRASRRRRARPRVSPTQTIAVRPARQAACALARTSASVSLCIGAPLGMADDHRLGAGVRQHLGRDIAGKGAGGLGVAVLPADRDPGARRVRGEARDQGRRRADHQVDLAAKRGRALRRSCRARRPRPSARSSSNCPRPAGARTRRQPFSPSLSRLAERRGQRQWRFGCEPQLVAVRSWRSL